MVNPSGGLFGTVKPVPVRSFVIRVWLETKMKEWLVYARKVSGKCLFVSRRGVCYVKSGSRLSLSFSSWEEGDCTGSVLRYPAYV